MRSIVLLVLVVLLQPCCASRAADEPQRVTLNAGTAVIGKVPASPGALPPSESLGAAEGNAFDLGASPNKLDRLALAVPLLGLGCGQ